MRHEPTASSGSGSSGSASDDSGNSGSGSGDDAPPTRRRAAPARRSPGRGQRRGVLLLAVAVLLVAVLGGAYYLFRSLTAAPDFDGPGEGDVVVQVADGDSTAAIGRTLESSGVVASVAAFLDAAREDERILGVQPGSYQMRARMSAAAAVERLLDPEARVGQLEIRGGVQLDDTSAPDGTVAPGVLSLISRASCARLDGAESCVSVDDLRAAMAETDPAELGVPSWALEAVSAADPVRRLEGLLVPGVYEVEPGRSAVEVLQALLATSTAQLEASGIVSGAAAMGYTPYEVLVISSLVEKEGITPDMPEVARVIYNRLGAGQRLELDSTVNYPLDLQALRTTAEDRARPGPYNSYATAGLPPTPIAAAGRDAIAAALAPEPGPWFFFVRCQTDGTSCFAETFPEHTANVALARENGAF
ncbi:endolytic transglycosylase MltG [Pseudonocardia sp. KRD-184]|uniref:Endolytic murein transglycosylase n=1 Tax=Pseudonocardia oceani TaxID=2792013 RepID=A0ABS6UJ53_9PSEU|nr:endolytic transglycosylase MltG [Pseudonocardia oceani]MBW0093892.1 endolytic transglycosylase MltG [Pseudonocardia oceani]MBW0100461.1 endolytic transglycosylase MltG [Pseudonocardia oceani]MBW0113241.1 endolytic transglycosylase MltG [Pseudonocardia oceani]MBW0124663.1 endolytic transglycosylase MltG [Pseudonocardia oceani]MBW0132256.1 endolytic transglycosylase MltG [Pseudonocardia oceani]